LTQDDQQQEHSAGEEGQQNGANVANDQLMKRLHECALAAVGVGVLALELERDGLHIGKRHGDGDAGFEAGDAEEVVTASPLLTTAEGVEGHPELGLADGGKGEGLWENADDGVGSTAEGDGLSDDVFSSGESLLPGFVAEDDGVGCAGLVFAGGEVASKDGCDA
jgi:hypothetical protein